MLLNIWDQNIFYQYYKNMYIIFEHEKYFLHLKLGEINIIYESVRLIKGSKKVNILILSRTEFVINYALFSTKS